METHSSHLPVMLLPLNTDAMLVPDIMVVDDSVTVRKVTTRLLERQGLEVITAKDGLEAMELLEETIPTLCCSTSRCHDSMVLKWYPESDTMPD